MKVLITAVISTLVFATPVTLFAADIDDGCAEVLRYSARDNSIEKSEIGIAMKIYDQYCENESVKSSSNFDAGLETVIKAVPVKFSLGSGSTEDRAKHFCKTFDADYKRNEQFYKSTSLVVASTTNAWLACKTLAGKGVYFRPQISKTQLLIEIVRKDSDNVTVNGITYDPKYASCSVPNTNGNKKTTVANKKTTKNLSSDSWTITCSRTPEVTANETIYPAFDISVGTTKGTFLMPIAADAKFPYQWSSELQQQLTQVASQTKSNSESLQRVRVEKGQIEIVADGTRPLHDGATCPPADDGNRGIRNRRHTFRVPFETEPEVIIAFSNIDSSTPRLRVRTISIDRFGFNYEFVTWCHTTIGSATASWIAIAK